MNAPLPPRAQAALLRTLELLAPDDAQLSAQAHVARANPASATFLDLEVPVDVATATVGDGPLPGRAVVADPDGEPIAELLVWISDGRLSALELAWFGEEPPTDWPDPEQISAG